ncbi:MAG: YiiX/YebB-like N1pC/P60 family cysteine hydrolase, partial [Actinomycetota bacterium]
MPGENDPAIRLEPCDMFLTRGTGFVPSAIRFFTRRFGESRTKVNHVGIIVEEGTMTTAIAIEALVKVKRHALGRYARKPDTAVAVYRPTNLTDAERQAIVAKAESYVGREYGFVKIAAHFLDWTLQGAYVFRRLTNMDRYPICSWVVAHAFGAAGKDFGCEPGAASP